MLRHNRREQYTWREREEASRRFLKPDAADTMNAKAREIGSIIPEFAFLAVQMKSGLKVCGRKVFWKPLGHMRFDSEMMEAVRACPGYSLVEQAVGRAYDAAQEINSLMGSIPFCGSIGISATWASRDLPPFFEKAGKALAVWMEREADFRVARLWRDLMDTANWRGYRKEERP